ncbi:GHMP kinase [Methanoculleus sp. FWC-SCC1]|uniref:GHMP kinase n=1 Tax=Methanoculleus frigidifontis TaxID=2584085 RepID=A0ABT8MCX7_9EURY|nr:GHMP kinase [Methanoculleus sp. FWC-SCC1]MDN7025803.1 GHMP kinase [Methanoculleus sp. FWC-SCC1]
MPIMKIRGGDLDLVEYDFPSFLPGENLRTLGFEKEYLLSPVRGTVRVRAPSRIHLTVLDMNRFAPDRPGGGGIGFAIKTYCTAEVECIPSGIEIEYSRIPILRHFVEVFRRVVGYDGGFRVRARDHMHEHVGLGSTSTILIAVANALNAAVGSPLTKGELRLLLGSNYVEETAEGSVAFGFETGVGPAVSTYGGMAVLGDELAVVYRHPFAEGKRVYIAIPPSGISSAGEKEFDLLMNKARTLDYRDRELKAYLVLMDLIPALERGDIARIGEVIWEIEFRGSKRAEVEHHGFELYRYMASLRDAGFEFVGMSSVGPSIAVITDRDEEDVAAILSSLGLTIAIATEVDNEGLAITLPER